ncbi:hypothetical protein SB6413_04554 [Klebsiella pasteurii]|nr:hypothetical protein SB6413_04554 [Klebsiella pasteurii]
MPHLSNVVGNNISIAVIARLELKKTSITETKLVIQPELSG